MSEGDKSKDVLSLVPALRRAKRAQFPGRKSMVQLDEALAVHRFRNPVKWTHAAIAPEPPGGEDAVVAPKVNRCRFWGRQFSCRGDAKWEAIPGELLKNVRCLPRQWIPMKESDWVEVKAVCSFERWTRVPFEWLELPTQMLLALVAIAESNEMFWKRAPWDEDSYMPSDVVRFIAKRLGKQPSQIRKMQCYPAEGYTAVSVALFWHHLQKLQRWRFNIEAMTGSKKWSYFAFPSFGFGEKANRILDWSLAISANQYRRHRCPASATGCATFIIKHLPFAAYGRSHRTLTRALGGLETTCWRKTSLDVDGDRMSLRYARHSEQDWLNEMLKRDRRKPGEDGSDDEWGEWENPWGTFFD